MSMPPMDQVSPQLWMQVSDVFHIQSRGTVVTGRLEGDGQLSLGDMLVCAGQSWQVTGIEQFRKVLKTVVPGADIGVMLKGGPPADVLRGMLVHFAPGSGRPRFDSAIGDPMFDPAVGGPQFTILPPKRRRWRR